MISVSLCNVNLLYCPFYPLSIVSSTVVTKDHNSSEPDTGKPSCQVIHEADCARTMTELFAVVWEQKRLLFVENMSFL